ncbi:NADH dehydrogenase [Operophtera brumata]|uniref:NADH dehydrogenase [ubiquinone] 1 beta subcomplex subunit 10 n=1 Tax=Operophtera brumata TaxID=104452 RepID=A0A0L7L3D6_OPEBR|nr:NADH dehydrogenase [Operophtera brumata]
MVQDDCPPDNNLFRAFARALYSTVDTPVTWFRETVVEPNQKQYPWYHQKYRRVPTIDQCYDGDVVCDFEANSQFKRDRFYAAETVVEPNQKQYPWYHQKYRRVPTIDQCYDGDVVCDFEANSQFKRDR